MATRDLSSAMLAAIAAGTVRHKFLFEGEFSDGATVETLRLWTGIGDLSWGGYTWAGTSNGDAQILGISEVEERIGTAAAGFTVTLSGIDPDAQVRALAAGQRNRPGRVLLALFDASRNVIADPYVVYRGRFDRHEIVDGAETSVITAYYESELIDLRRARHRRYTTLDQRRDYPTDTGFNRVPGLVNLDIRVGG